jgi:hypothetical protein
MSAVTAKVKERFSGAILDGAPFSLDLGDAAVLAAFTFMKATVKDYCFGNDPFFTRADRERLRISLKLPDMARVWFAAHHGSARRTFRSNFNIASVSDRNPLQGMEFFCYTYIVGNLVLQLLAPRWKDVCDRNKPLVTLIPDSYWDPAVTKFWPYPSEAISWPPEKLLGDHVVEQFIYRFQVPINWRG